MNNHMRSTKTKFYNPRENRGGGLTGTKDSNFTKEQANEGKYYKSNSLKITLINPINWRKHEEIWDNLISLSLGLADLEKYLVKQFNYICFPYSYDIKIKYNSSNLKVVETIGVGEKKIEGNNNVDICDIGTAVPSELTIINDNIYMEGGLILLKLKKITENKDIDSGCEIMLEYFDRNNKKYEQYYKYNIKKY